MRVFYSVRFEDFKSLQRPFTLRAGDNAGFKGVVVACALMALLGGFCIWRGTGILVGGFLIGLGVLAGGCVYIFEKVSVVAKNKKHDENLAAKYLQIHCREERLLEADEVGFTTKCKCGTVTRPWSELTSFSENDKHFALNTKMGGQVFPKAAFPSTAEVTEFRALATGKLNQDRTAASPHFDFALRPSDYRAAYWLHILKGGGWRGLGKALLVYVAMIYGAWVLWNSIGAHNEGVRAGLIGGFVALPLLRIAGKRRKGYFGPMRVYFGEDGLHLQDSTSQARTSWKQFVGYVESTRLILLYYNPKFYRVIPKRALTGQGSRFLDLVGTKLRPFDYRKAAYTQIEKSPSQPTVS